MIQPGKKVETNTNCDISYQKTCIYVRLVNDLIINIHTFFPSLIF